MHGGTVNKIAGLVPACYLQVVGIAAQVFGCFVNIAGQYNIIAHAYFAGVAVINGQSLLTVPAIKIAQVKVAAYGFNAGVYLHGFPAAIQFTVDL